MISVRRDHVLTAGSCNACLKGAPVTEPINVIEIRTIHQGIVYRLCDTCIEELIHQYEKRVAPIVKPTRRR